MSIVRKAFSNATTSVWQLPKNLRSQALSRTISMSHSSRLPYGHPRFEQLKGRVIMVAGASGHLGSKAMVQAAQEGAQVIGVVRNPTYTRIYNPNVSVVALSETEMKDPEAWERLVRSFGKGKNLTLVNAVGKASGVLAELRETNVKPTAAMAKGLENVAKSRECAHVSFVQLSSLAADMLNETPYGRSKLEADAAIMATCQSLAHVMMLRIGYTVPALSPDKDSALMTSTHAYEAPQMTMLPYQVLIGSGRQMLQPLSEDDVVGAMLATVKGGMSIIRAVGHDKITQLDFVRFFSNLVGREFNPLHIDYDTAYHLAHHFPKGHLQPYAVDGCRLLEDRDWFFDVDPLTKLLGRAPKTLEELYHTGQEIVITRPPCKEHIMEIFKRVVSDPDARRASLLVAHNLFKILRRRERDSSKT